MQMETRTGISRSIVGVFDSSDEAQRALEQLRADGLGPDEVSVMMRDTHVTESIQEQAASSPVAGGAAAGAALGGLLGGLAGWMVAIGAIAIPGVGLVVGAGALAAMLAGIALGAATGGLIGGLLSLGVPEDEARQYEDHLREGRVLLTVHPSPDFEIARATGILEANGAYDVRVYDSPPQHTTGEADLPEVPQPLAEPFVGGGEPVMQPQDMQEIVPMTGTLGPEVAGTEVSSADVEDRGALVEEDAVQATSQASAVITSETVLAEPNASNEDEMGYKEIPESETKTEESSESVNEIRKHYQPE